MKLPEDAWDLLGVMQHKDSAVSADLEVKRETTTVSDPALL